jgi:ABC-2 type transport system ATP-binding protein
MSHTLAIQVTNLSKSFKNLKVLDGINLSVERGTIFALLGPNGAGKTTTVKILTTLLQPDGGQAVVNGIDVVKNPDAVRATIGLTGQYAAVDEYLNGYENLEMMGRLYHLSGKDAKSRAHELLKQFDLVDAAKRQVKTYSGGMRRRLDLALSLIAVPPVIFLDEPTTGLDPRSRMSVWNIVNQLAESGTTILLTTQYLEEADQLASRIAVIDNGKVIAEGTPDELKQRVGKDRFELSFAKESDFTTAQTLIKGEGIKLDPKHRTISIATSNNVEDVRHILDLMTKHNIGIESLSLHKPTLDDVFLDLTGKHTVETETAEGDQ